MGLKDSFRCPYNSPLDRSQFRQFLTTVNSRFPSIIPSTIALLPPSAQSSKFLPSIPTPQPAPNSVPPISLAFHIHTTHLFRLSHSSSPLHSRLLNCPFCYVFELDTAI